MSKKYGLVWEDHPEPIEELLKTHEVVLEEVKAREIKLGEPNSPHHLLIEGDNYEALTYLKQELLGKVNVIYIDPPYNTKNKTFKYNDHYENHSKWLSFMSKRLLLAKELLNKDGAIFISIGNDEFAQLKLLCEQIFGENNIETIIWQKTDSQVDKNTNSKQIRRFKSVHEYIIVCYRNKSIMQFNKMMKLPNWKNSYTNPDKDPRGAFKQGIISFKEGHAKEDRNSEYYYSVTTPYGETITRHWFMTKDEFDKKNEDNRIYFPKKGKGIPAEKVFENEEKEYFMESILRGVGTSSTAKDELLQIFGNRDIFETPKPTKLIKEIIRVSSKKDSIILDFFAGSGTTGQAVLELNKEDGGNRQFILCTNNENNICEEVTYERLNKVINGYTTPKGKEVQGVSANLKYLKTKLESKEEIA